MKEQISHFPYTHDYITLCVIKFVENLSKGKKPGFHQVCSKLHDGHVAYTNTMTHFHRHIRWQYSCDKCYGLKLVLVKGLLDQHQHKTHSSSAV